MNNYEIHFIKIKIENFANKKSFKILIQYLYIIL